MNNRVRWGVLGTASIARNAVIPAMLKPDYSKHSQIVAIASRDLLKAESMAAEFDIPRSFGSYQALLADDQIDAVYIPLPNHLHVPLAIEALESGKHVLCEKPIGLSVAEAEQLAEAGRRHPQLKLMEAFMYRFHPQWTWAKQAIDDGTIGELRTVHSFFSFFEDGPDGILHHPEWGGGGLMDIGCYPVSLSRFLFQDEPHRVVGVLEEDPRFQVDRLTSGIMEFSAGTATFTCATQLADYQRVIAFGTKGRVEIEIPFNPPVDQPCRVTLEVDEKPEVIEFDACDHYGIQADLFSQAILDDTPVPTPIDDAVANMRVIEAIKRSGESGDWEVVRQ